ncbi:hypothetical protein LAZ67_14001223 [Cordylochernes scorpioides]|uniref:Uncharacterized protein n=1 Tax=Cordylochernes scorpioides TaxID=51811 RepID=A0ABY6LAT9_9ARAC|nr:hypothetical protein LAZ67_14001223 [Cordylochernes scorpioides]
MWQHKVITGAETWVYAYNSETKCQSNDKPRPKNAKTEKCEIEFAVESLTKREEVLEYLSSKQISALKKFLDKAIAHVGDKDSDLGKRLSDFRAECDIDRDDTQWYSSDANDL